MPEHRLFAHQLADSRDGLRVILRISGAVGEHHAVAAGSENFARRGVRREDRQRTAAVMQAAQNAALEAEVHHRDVILALARHFVGFFARALRHLVVHLKRFGQFKVGFRRFSLDDAAAQRA